MWSIILTILRILSGLIFILKKNFSKEEIKWSQFECGFSSITPSHTPFSFQFFLVALLFLIFDIEIALVFSFPLEQSSTKNLLLLYLFLIVLTFGLFYEWEKNKIDWSNWLWPNLCKNSKDIRPTHPQPLWKHPTFHAVILRITENSA